MKTKYTTTKATVWSQPNCTYCQQAKALLTSKNIPYTENMLGANGLTKEDLLKAVPTARTVPQIFLDDEYVGGFMELKKLLADDNT